MPPRIWSPRPASEEDSNVIEFAPYQKKRRINRITQGFHLAIFLTLFFAAYKGLDLVKKTERRNPCQGTTEEYPLQRLMEEFEEACPNLKVIGTNPETKAVFDKINGKRDELLRECGINPEDVTWNCAYNGNSSFRVTAR